MNKQVYKGEHSLENFLAPSAHVFTPLVELPESLNPFLKKGVHIYVKMLNMLPLANVKSIPAWNMLTNADQSLVGGDIVESSSGNTVFSLGLLSSQFGIKKVHAVASRDVSKGKLDLLRIANIDVQLVDGPLCPSPNDPKSSITIARKLGEQPGWYNPGQYDNNSNPEAHKKYTAPQIYDQLDGDVSMLVVGLGTTGSLVGIAEYFKLKKPGIRVIGAVRAPNNAVPGVRTKNGLDEVGFEWKANLTDDLVTVNEYDSYEKSLAMIRQGLLVGPSAGFAYAATLKHLEVMEANHTLDDLENKNVVFIAPDSMFPYVSEYFEVLDDSYFGKVDNQTSRTLHREASGKIADVPELTVEDVYNDYIQGERGLTPQHYQLIDIRDHTEYVDHHLPSSTNVPYDELDAWLDSAKQDKPMVFICRRGSTSLYATKLANRKKLEAYSMLGGTAEWSDRDYPRVKAPFC